MKNMAISFILVLSAISTPSPVEPPVGSDIVDEVTPPSQIRYLSYEELDYVVKLYEYNLTLVVTGRNSGSDPELSALNIQVDRSNVEQSFDQIPIGGTVHKSYDLADFIAANRQNHIISVGTFGDHQQMNFSLNVNSSNPQGVELPEIENVEVTTVEVDGEETAAARVTVRNDGNVQYGTRIRITTLQTHSGSHIARVPLDSNRRTLVIPLNEDPELQIAGEVRLFTGWVHNHSRIEDQVEFEGRTDGETTVWDRDFEPIQIDYANTDVQEYQYHNETVKRKNDAIWRERLKPVGIVAAGMLVVLLLVVALLSRYR